MGPPDWIALVRPNAAVGAMPWVRFECEKVDNRSVQPYRGTPDSAGFDVFALEDIVMEP